MSSIPQLAAEFGHNIEDSLRQLTERGANHEGRLRLIEVSDSADMAFVKEQLKDIKAVLDLLLAMAKTDEEAHNNG